MTDEKEVKQSIQTAISRLNSAIDNLTDVMEESHMNEFELESIQNVIDQLEINNQELRDFTDCNL